MARSLIFIITGGDSTDLFARASSSMIGLGVASESISIRGCFLINLYHCEKEIHKMIDVDHCSIH